MRIFIYKEIVIQMKVAFSSFHSCLKQLSYIILYRSLISYIKLQKNIKFSENIIVNLLTLSLEKNDLHQTESLLVCWQKSIKKSLCFYFEISTLFFCWIISFCYSFSFEHFKFICNLAILVFIHVWDVISKWSDFEFVRYVIIVCEWIFWFHDLTISFSSATVYDDTSESFTSLSRYEETVLKENHNIKWVSCVLYILIMRLIANIWNSVIERKYYIFCR